MCVLEMKNDSTEDMTLLNPSCSPRSHLERLLVHKYSSDFHHGDSRGSSQQMNPVPNDEKGLGGKKKKSQKSWTW